METTPTPAMTPAALCALLASPAGQRRVATLLRAGQVTARQIMEARNAPEDRAALVALARRAGR